MWEAYELENEDLLWASTAFRGGIAGQQRATCGALASSAVSLGLRHHRPLTDKKKAEQARETATKEAHELVGDFIEEFGAVACIDLVGVDLSSEEAREKAREAGLFEEKCHNFVVFVVEKLFELEEKRSRKRTI